MFTRKHSNEENIEEEYEYECSECGDIVSKDDKVCPHCGADLSEIDQESDDSAVQNSAAFSELYNAAVKLVVEHQKASVSLLQRKFKIGYARAGRLIDQLERGEIIGPFQGSKPREVLLKNLDNTPRTKKPQIRKDLSGADISEINENTNDASTEYTESEVLLNRAAALIVKHQKVDFLQLLDHLNIDYYYLKLLLDELTRVGIIGPEPDKYPKQRQILIRRVEDLPHIKGIPVCKDVEGNILIKGDTVDFIKPCKEPKNELYYITAISRKEKGKNRIAIWATKEYYTTNKNVRCLTDDESRNRLMKFSELAESPFPKKDQVDECTDIKDQHVTRENPVRLLSNIQGKFIYANTLDIHHDSGNVFNLRVRELSVINATNEDIEKDGFVYILENGDEVMLAPFDCVEIVSSGRPCAINRLIRTDKGTYDIEVFSFDGEVKIVDPSDLRMIPKREFELSEREYRLSKKEKEIERRLQQLKQKAYEYDRTSMKLEDERNYLEKQRMDSREASKKWTPADKAVFAGGAAFMGLGLYKLGKKIAKDINKVERKRLKDMRNYLEKGTTYIPFTGFGDDDDDE